jgi:dTDP-4-dehydrorhamnose 3,5-epimerase
MPFERLDTRIDGVGFIQPKLLGDERGFFVETYRRNEFAELGIDEEMVQDNHSRSKHGIVRGMHFQIGAGAAKLIRCGRGQIVDVVVDLRRGSPTFGEWEAFELSDENGRQLFVPVGFAHGFCVVSDIADVTYKVSNYYDSASERGIAFDDPDLGVTWPVDEPLVSERDRGNPRLKDVAGELPW